jgi:hypothetical protein
MVMFLITSIGLLAGCGADYGYAFHFYVDGGNGEISIETTPSFFWLAALLYMIKMVGSQKKISGIFACQGSRF